MDAHIIGIPESTYSRLIRMWVVALTGARLLAPWCTARLSAGVYSLAESVDLSRDCAHLIPLLLLRDGRQASVLLGCPCRDPVRRFRGMLELLQDPACTISRTDLVGGTRMVQQYPALLMLLKYLTTPFYLSYMSVV